MSNTFGQGEMPQNLRVNPEDLHVSAGTVDAHADTVRVCHVEADSRVEASQRGVPTAAGAALSGVMAKWQTDTTAIFSRMVDHAHGLRTGALAYVQTDQSSGTSIESTGQQIDAADL